MADDQDQQSENPNLEQLRKKAEEADRLRAELRERDRKEAFAGLDMESPLGKMLAKVYEPPEGESYSRDGLEAFALEQGFSLSELEPKTEDSAPAPEATTPPPQTNPQSPYAGEQQGVQNVATTLGDAGEDIGNPTDLSNGNIGREVHRAFTDARGTGRPTDQAQVEGVRAIFEAAGQGNPTVLYDQRRWREQNGG